MAKLHASISLVSDDNRIANRSRATYAKENSLRHTKSTVSNLPAEGMLSPVMLKYDRASGAKTSMQVKTSSKKATHGAVSR